MPGVTSTPVPLIEISGTPRERGQAYGESAREQIGLSVAYYREAFAESSGLGWADVLAEAAQWGPVVEAAAPQLISVPT